jgi:hypothetical protein
VQRKNSGPFCRFRSPPTLALAPAPICFTRPGPCAVIGGVITSTFLTLLVIPTVWEILDQFREWLMAKAFRRRAQAPRELAAESGD